MRRSRQSLEEILESLSPVESSWRDAHADTVIALLTQIPDRTEYEREDLERLLSSDFQAATTIFRLALDLSKDEFHAELKSRLGSGAPSRRHLREGDGAFVGALVDMGVLGRLSDAVRTPVTWRSLFVERLKSGRGSAIKGQARGRGLEDFVESIVREVFGDGAYHCRCRFVGATRQSTEKADFAIPSRDDPRILIEVKAYGATGSKQTDILGDIARITEEKRHDTDLLFVTDGIPWRSRVNDLRRLVEMQNSGLISRIYTRAMRGQLESDLLELRRDHAL